jgi:hypothetical protein
MPLWLIARLNELAPSSSSPDTAAHWSFALPVALVVALALVQAVVLPRRRWAKGIWLLAVVICGAVAFADLRWDERHRQGIANDEVAALQGLWQQWDRVAQTLPAAGAKPAASFATTADALASLDAQVAGIKEQIALVQAQSKTQSKGRAIDAETADKLADYLRQYGSRPAIVSCVPDDTEAYYYANQLVNILKAAGWDARGPEITAARGEDATAMGVVVSVHDPRTANAAKIVLDAFTRFNIPYQSGIVANDTIPDPASVELFVAKKP